MELPQIGENCNEPTCNKLDFLPVKCDACGKIFCCDHMNYEKHNCPNAYEKNVKVPTCPLCGLPVPTPRNQKPDIAVSEHMDNDCKADPNKAKKKISSNKCNVPGCKVKEMIPVICPSCKKNFCLLHRFPDVHFCSKLGKNQVNPATKKIRTENNSSHIKAIHGSMTEDEAFAAALAESMKDADRNCRSSQRSSENSVNSFNHQRCQVS